MSKRNFRSLSKNSVLLLTIISRTNSDNRIPEFPVNQPVHNEVSGSHPCKERTDMCTCHDEIVIQIEQSMQQTSELPVLTHDDVESLVDEVNQYLSTLVPVV